MSSKLDLMQPSKTVVFYTPFEGDNVITRTGVLTTENSLIHSVLYANDKDYVVSKGNKKQKMCQKLYNKLYSDEEFQQYMETEFHKFYSDPSSKEYSSLFQNDNDKEGYDILLELLDVEQLIDDLVLSKDRLCSNDFFDNYFENKLGDKLVDIPDKHREFLKTKLINLYDLLVKNYKIDIQTIVTFLSEKLDIDIYVIDVETRLPIKLDKSNIQVRDSVIVLKIDDKFEVLGKLMPKKQIQRVFDEDDAIIKSLYYFLYKPDKVSKRYPYLEKYLQGASPKQKSPEFEF